MLRMSAAGGYCGGPVILADAKMRLGALAHWRIGALARWRTGALAYWRTSALEYWSAGALARCLRLCFLKTRYGFAFNSEASSFSIGVGGYGRASAHNNPATFYASDDGRRSGVIYDAALGSLSRDWAAI